MGEMVERIAQWLCRRSADSGHIFAKADGDDGWHSLMSEEGREGFRREARELLGLMREPTPAMIEALSGFMYEGWGDGEAIARQAYAELHAAALAGPSAGGK